MTSALPASGSTATSGRPAPGGAFPLAGRPVPRIGYGLGKLARRAAAHGEQDAAIALLHQVVDLGITHLDTALFYGEGLANELIRQALGDRRDELVIATKAGARPVPGAAIPLTAAQRPAELRATVEANLLSLGTDRLDVVNLRRLDFLPGLLAEGDQVVPLDDQLAEMSALRDEGKVLAIGLSHITEQQLRAALPVGIACVQNLYNMVDRSSEPLLQVCREHDIAWVPYFPLGGGFGDLPQVTDEPAVQAVAARTGATPSQVGLAWQLAHAPNTLLIPGTSSLDHLLENTAAADVVLDDAAMLALDEVSARTGR